MMVNNMMRNLNRNLLRMERTQRQLTSGKKFVNPSDDPIGVSRSLRLNTEMATMDQFKRNADDINSWLSTTEMAVKNMNEIFKRAKELTIQAINETNSINERNSIAEEIEELRNQLVQLGNTTYAGSYVFSGYKTDKRLLNDDGTYDIGGNGNRLTLDEVIEVNIGIGDRMGLNALGQRLFGLCPDSYDDADLDTIPIDTLNQKQSMAGSYVSATAAEPLVVNGSIELTCGTFPSVVVDISNSYTSLDDLASAIESGLAGTDLDGHVDVYVKDNRLVFESDDKMSIKSATPATLNLSSIGMYEDQTSTSRVDTGDKSQLIAIFDQLIKDLRDDNTEGLSKGLSRIEKQSDNINAIRAELGVKMNRVELTTNRILDDTLNLKELLSKNEDADIAEVIMNLMMQEYVYKASLSGGARVIQPTLVDFLS
jgi:flagellar hook-associated protein 3 FlgL